MKTQVKVVGMICALFRIGSLLLGLAWMASATCAQNTWVVDASASGPGNGSSQDPYVDIRFALAQGATQSGDTLLVKPGSYPGGIDFDGKAVRLLGEFGESQTTILSPSSGSTLLANSQENGLVVEGFTIQGGTGTLSGGQLLGGALYCNSSSVLLRDCVVDGGSARDGGCIAISAASLQLEEVQVRNGQASFRGGGLASLGNSSVMASDCLFESNVAAAQGGGVVVAGTGFGPHQWSECVFRLNRADSGGGYSGNNESVLIDCVLTENCAAPVGGFGLGGGNLGPISMTRCEISKNLCNGQGAGVNLGTLVDCEIWGNRMLVGFIEGTGAGVYGASLLRCRIYDNCFDSTTNGFGGGCITSDVVQCQIFNNRAPVGGGTWDVDLEACTVYGNQATASMSGGIGVTPALVFVNNCIVWGNTPMDIADPGQVAVTFSNVGTTWPGPGNISQDPEFWFPDAGDFHLRSGSPAIDAGDPGGVLDTDGSVQEMGALTFDVDYCPSTDLHCVALMDSAGCAAAIQVTGQPSFDSAQVCLVQAFGVQNGKNGLFFYGINGRADLPFLGGTLCVQPPLRRTTIQNAGGTVGPPDCTGHFDFDLNLWLQSNADPFVVPGTQLDGQFWYRDPLASAGSGLSNAMSGVVCP